MPNNQPFSGTQPHLGQAPRDPGGINRRNLFAVSALLGGGAALAPAQVASQSAQAVASAARVTTAAALNSVYAKARELMYPTCRVCPECNGVACSGESSGIGGIGSGMAFQNNFHALQRVHLNMRTLTSVTRADASITLFGQKLSFPVVAAPMGANAAGFGKGMPVNAFFDALIDGCNDAGIAGAIGEAPAPNSTLQSRIDIIARNHGRAVYGIKPASNASILKLAPMLQAAGTFLVTIDIDSAGRYNRNAPPEATYNPKSVAEIRELVHGFKIPLLVKGIMTPDEAELALEAGAAGIVVSNHGGRVLDHTPGAIDALPAIAGRVKGKAVILVDGCIHYGTDVLKCVALGADAVMVGRHLIRAAYGGGREGVALFMNTMRDEFERAMVLTGASRVSDISRKMIA